MKTPAPHRVASPVKHLLELILTFASTVGNAAESQRSDARSSPPHDSLNPKDRDAIPHPGSVLRSRVILTAFVSILVSRRQGTRYPNREYSQKPALPEGTAFAVRYVSE
jgi:hypothetical protein